MINERTQGPYHYQIEIEGCLDPRWQEWFEGLALTTTSAGCTILSGPMRDQAALYGVLKRINNLGLTLLSVKRQQPGQR